MQVSNVTFKQIARVATGAGLTNSGVIEALRLLIDQHADTSPDLSLSLMMIMQRAEAVEEKLSSIALVAETAGARIDGLIHSKMIEDACDGDPGEEGEAEVLKQYASGNSATTHEIVKAARTNAGIDYSRNSDLVEQSRAFSPDIAASSIFDRKCQSSSSMLTTPCTHCGCPDIRDCGGCRE